MDLHPFQSPPCAAGLHSAQQSFARVCCVPPRAIAIMDTCTVNVSVVIRICWDWVGLGWCVLFQEKYTECAPVATSLFDQRLILPGLRSLGQLDVSSVAQDHEGARQNEQSQGAKRVHSSVGDHRFRSPHCSAVERRGRAFREAGRRALVHGGV